MPSCAAINCANNERNGFKFHAFPRNVARRRQWAQQVNRDFSMYPDDLPPVTMKLCEAHFTDDQYVENARFGRILKADAVPTLFFGDDAGEAGENVGADRNFGDEPEQYDMEDEYIDHEELDMDFEEEEQIPDDGVNWVPDDDNNGDHRMLLDHLTASQNRIQYLERELERVKKEKRDMWRKSREWQKKYENTTVNLRKFLEDDQIDRLRFETRKVPKPWSETTIKKALQIKFMCNTQGYEFLRTQMNYPLPSNKTLNRRLQKLPFEPGLDNSIIQYLGMKIRGETGASDCYVSIDEMAITPKVEFDKGLQRYVGYISPEIASRPEETKMIATKVCAYVVKGLGLHWKQCGAYLLTGPSTDPDKMWECMKIFIHKLHVQGLIVRGVSMDMGPDNVAMWSVDELKIHATRGAEIRNSIPHPEDDQLRLYFSPDLPHALKNMWAGLCEQDFYLPDHIVAEHPEWEGNNVVSIRHLRALLTLQDKPMDRGLVIQHKLKKYHIRPSTLQKMCVGSAATVFSHRTATALNFCAENPEILEIDDGALPTAWFLELIDEIFHIMNDRKHGIDGGERGAAKIKKLQKFRDEVVKHLQFEKKGWKPHQTSFMLSITSIIQLHEDLVLNGSFHYLLPGRMTTDSVENLWSQLRGRGDSHPSVIRVRYGLRLISVSQLVYVPKNSNYEIDDAEYVVDFLAASAKPATQPFVRHAGDAVLAEELTIIQNQGVYYVAGWAAKKAAADCAGCQGVLISDVPLDDCPSQFTSMLSNGGLCHPSQAAYDAVWWAEALFDTLKDAILHRHNVIEGLLNEILRILEENLDISVENTCRHNALESLVRRFLNMRVHVHAADRSSRQEI